MTSRDDHDDYINFGDVARDRCSEQSQYVSRYLDEANKYYLGEGIRTRGNPREYHELKIHRNDVESFVSRYLEHRQKAERGEL